MISNIVFILILGSGVFLFAKRIGFIRRNINLGRDVSRNDNPKQRWLTMIRVALGQSKMLVRPVPAFFHIIIYVGFIIINIEVLEIIIDGIFGTHRIFAFAGVLYDFLIGSFEVLAAGVLLSCIVFLCRRNILRIKRFRMREMTSWPRSDANIILTVEILLMTAFLTMNCTDYILQSRGVEHYTRAGAFPVSSLFSGLFLALNDQALVLIERGCWWFHIIGIMAFLVYVPYSKHFHILISFPNTWYSNLNPIGQFTNMDSVTNEVRLMLDPAAVVPVADPGTTPQKFGAKDVTDLTWKQLMDAYSCTECGRCSSVCPANLTGKLLSPRKIMMDTRDRLEELGTFMDRNENKMEDGKSLLNDYVLPEELWACTTCNACVEACPVNIDPLSIIIDMRRFLIMEQSAAPAELNSMLTKIENNGAPWQFSPADRLNWAGES